ncbi:hypothetical protein B0H66DRAFT_485832 [Apodospora peruviana]|uniref:DUF4238 domain-containing protein n=1 Tax=Apodospora peruviana TaxID=516989 RepID=A0AAE0HV31_9PEZI|nr:hypothetical protein B0H66DRAFT_485832 [Apodospora peruviana]
MAASPSAQYQHFVPQFLLRNFAHPYTPEGYDPKKKKRASKRKYEKGMFPGDPVVRNIDFGADPPAICEKPVKRILGLMNMYDDDSKSDAKQQKHIELMFSKLEAQASQMFRKITKAFEKQEPGLWITRDERNLIRKFLFIQKYRGLTFHTRFNYDNPDTYEANDRELMLEYMAEKGFARPLDVWFDNIKAIIEVEMDLEAKWRLELPKRMFPTDAMWFFSHVDHSYMAICTPSCAEEEFILTDNSYNIFEGPSTFVQDADSGKLEGGLHANIHDFAPISPKLMIVLRSHVLPNPLEDANPRVREWRAHQRHLVLDEPYGEKITSVLEDLPVEKARNNYTRVVDGQIELLEGEDGRMRKDHRYFFRFFGLGTEHVNKINAILLDNIEPCTSVVFESTDALARTLEWYLTECRFGKRIITGEVRREAALRKLETVSRALGSEKETVMERIDPQGVVDVGKFLHENVEVHRFWNKTLFGDRKDFLGGMRQTDTPWAQLYFLVLDGTPETLIYDREQIRLMWQLRVKLDAWSQGVHEAIRVRNRELLTAAYLRLPPHRVWLYTEFVVYMQLEQHPHLEAIPVPPPGSCPQDMIARGIKEVEQLCRQAQVGILQQNLHGQAGFNSYFFKEGEVVELLTRVVVRDRFLGALKGKLERSLLKDLKKVLFENAYPTPPKDWRC